MTTGGGKKAAYFLATICVILIFVIAIAPTVFDFLPEKIRAHEYGVRVQSEKWASDSLPIIVTCVLMVFSLAVARM